MGHKCRGHQGHNKLHVKKTQQLREKQEANKQQRGGLTRSQYERFLKAQKKGQEHAPSST